MSSCTYKMSPSVQSLITKSGGNIARNCRKELSDELLRTPTSFNAMICILKASEGSVLFRIFLIELGWNKNYLEKQFDYLTQFGIPNVFPERFHPC